MTDGDQVAETAGAPLAAEFAARVTVLEKELRAKDVDAKIDDLKRKGKLAPAAESFARSLLMAADDQVVTFADPLTGAETSGNVAKAFESFLDAQPKVIEFAEVVHGSGEEGSAFSTEDERLFDQLGVSVEAVERHRRRK